MASEIEHIVEIVNDLIPKFLAKQIHWTAISGFLCQLEDAGYNMNLLDMNYSRIRELIKAHRFVKTRRPEWLENPRDDVYAVTISALPGLYRNMRGKNREEEFEKLVDSVLSGQLKVDNVRLIAQKYKRSSTFTLADIARDEADALAEKPVDLMKALESTLILSNYLLDEAIKEYGMKKIRAFLGGNCNALSNKLKCVADEEFNILWGQRQTEEI